MQAICIYVVISWMFLVRLTRLTRRIPATDGKCLSEDEGSKKLESSLLTEQSQRRKERPGPQCRHCVCILSGTTYRGRRVSHHPIGTLRLVLICSIDNILRPEDGKIPVRSSEIFRSTVGFRKGSILCSWYAFGLSQSSQLKAPGL